MPKRTAMKPKKTGGKIESVEVGPKGTFITIRLNTKRLAVQAGRKAGHR